MTAPRPMDPEPLARLRVFIDEWTRDPKHSDPDALGPCEVADLLADRDYHARRADAAERECEGLREIADAHRSAASNLRMTVSADRGGTPCHSTGGGDCPPEGWHYIFGGPYTSYTLPEPLDGGVLHWWRFDQDEGTWCEMESLAARIVSEVEEIEVEEKWEAKVEAVAAERDTARTEVARLRARVLVESRDVTEITPGQVVGYLTAAGWMVGRVISNDGELLWSVMLKGDRGLDVPMMPTAVDYGRIIASLVNELAVREGLAALDILDEMAAMEVEP